MGHDGGDDVWQHYKRVTKPLPIKPTTKTRQPSEKLESGKDNYQARRQAAVTQKTALRLESQTLPNIKLERRREKILREGNFDVDATLDLHGMTQEKAFAALDSFVNAQHRKGNRVLLIVTGKGRAGQGLLRQNVPQWLASLDCSRHILTIRQAAIPHGGEGALYIVLRKSGKK